MRKLAMTLVLLAAGSAVSGCGIGPGPVVTHGKVQPEDQLNQYSTKDLMRPENLRDPVDLVTRYLYAAADKPDTQLQTLRSFMQDKSWTPDSDELNIYRVLGAPVNEGQRDNTIPVSVTVQRVGALKSGRIEPVYEERTSLQFRVVIGSGGALFETVPNSMILSDLMLHTRYQARPVYFWDNAHKRLIPDLRYIPSDILEQEKAKLLIEYLYAPPPSWLLKAIKLPPPPEPKRTNPVYNADGTMTIDLPNQLSESDLARLTAQLKATLVRGSVTGIQLKIQGVPVQAASLEPANDSKPAARFGVQQQKVVRLDFGPDRSAVPIAPEVNAGVEWAVFSRREDSVAMSRLVNGARQFLIGPGGAPKPATVPGGKPIDQAAWLEGESRAALVLSDRKLYEVLPGVDPAKAVTQLAGPVPGPVTSFSVVPDGRIALVVDKKLYMAALYRNGETLTITQPQQVPTALDQVQHVALSRLDAVIAGVGLDENKQTKLVVTQINVDGAQQLPAWTDYGVGEQISHLVADYRTRATYYDYKGVAHLVSSSGASPVTENQAVPLPGPSASSAPPPPITAVSFEG